MARATRKRRVAKETEAASETLVDEAPRRRRRLFLATAYGFAGSHMEGRHRVLRCILTALGAEVREPLPIGEVNALPPGWAWRVGRQHAEGVRGADGLFAVVNGSPPDEGVMIEVGMAVALRMPVFLFRDDRRQSGGDDGYPLNLMLFAGHTCEGWRDFWYTDLADLGNPAKGLVRWLTPDRAVSVVVPPLPDTSFDDGIPF